MSAPSFSSFPPEFSSFPDIEAGPSDPHGRRSKKDEGKASEKRKGKNKRDSKHRPSRVEAKHEYAEEQLKFENGIREDPSTQRLFYSDTRGDPLNIKYGGLHLGDIPKYHAVGRGRKILGLNNAWTVVHRGRSGLEVAVGGKRKLPSINDSNTKHMLKAPPTYTLVNSARDIYQYREIDGFLRLPLAKAPTRPDSHHDVTLRTEERSDESESESDSDGSTTDGDSKEPSLTSLQLTLKSLEEQLKIDPRSIPTWLNLLFHTLSTIPDDAKNARKMKSEVALSVLSRAMDADSSNKKSKFLRLQYLMAGEETWPKSKLQEEWENALSLNDVDVWIEWLDWRIWHMGSLEDVVSDAEKVISSLRSISDEIGSLRAFWRIAIAFKDAGYTERATALFQAQAELSFKKPSSLVDAPFTLQLKSLEVYWEAEVPRVGDAGATGWSVWESSGRPEGEHVSSGRHVPVSDAQDPFIRWATDELAADRSSIFPRRSDDEESDPYATILFSDIQPFLVDIKSIHAKEVFRLMWLSILGLHIPGFAASLSSNAADNRDDRWCSTAFVSPFFFSSLFPRDPDAKLLTSDAQAGVLIGREREYGSPFGPVKEWGYGTVGALDTIGNPPCGLWTKTDVSGIDEAVVREVFSQVRLSDSDVDWNILRLAFEAAVSPKNATKLSKSLLFMTQNSLPQWATHARLNRLRGRLDDARNVYQTVLTSADLNSPGYYILWWDWVEMEWLSSSPEAALKLIFRCTNLGEGGGVAILRARRRLDDAANSLPSTRWREQDACLRLRALLELLTASPAIAASVFDSLLAKLAPGSVQHEGMTMSSLCLLYKHGSTLRNPLPPTLLRERVEKAIHVYPSNTILLGLFLEAEKGQSVWGRVRLLLGDQPVERLLRPKDLARRIAEVWAAGWERGAWKAEEERTRSGLAAALQDDRTKYSPILWRICLEFEIRTGELQRAKKLLFRAVGECPLVKELYLLAFGPLRSVFSPQELNEFAETMAERGIRMRKGLDEVLGGWVKPALEYHHTVRYDEDAEDEIEYNARELRRLRPY